MATHVFTDIMIEVLGGEGRDSLGSLTFAAQQCTMLRQLIRRTPVTRMQTYNRLSLAHIRPLPTSSSYYLQSSKTRVNDFHSTPQRQGGPLVPLFAAMLKVRISILYVANAQRM